jgi:hypothetical protein
MPPSLALLQAYLFWNIGIRGIVAFIANTYPPSANAIARAYNWQEGSHLQRELAANMGAVGLLGVLCLKFDGLFWLATILAGTLSCIISEIGNLTTLLKAGQHPFSKAKTESSYIVSLSLFVGMHLDLIMSFLMLGLGLYTLFP